MFHIPAVEAVWEKAVAFSREMLGFMYLAQAALGMILGKDVLTVPCSHSEATLLTSLYSFLVLCSSTVITLLSMLQQYKADVSLVVLANVATARRLLFVLFSKTLSSIQVRAGRVPGVSRDPIEATVAVSLSE